MMKKLLVFSSIFLFSCVTPSIHNDLVKQNEYNKKRANENKHKYRKHGPRTLPKEGPEKSRFFVVDCNIITASVPITSWYCNSLTVDFINNSFNAENYFWDFGDTQNPNSTSFSVEPTYTYPDSV